MRTNVRVDALASVLLILSSLLWLAGCSAPEIEVRNEDGVLLTPAGKTAVLKVTASPIGRPKSLAMAWGVMEVPNAPERFAELLGHVAREVGGMDAISPVDAAAALEKAGLEPTLDPSPQQIEAFAQVLGCACYLTAHVETWGSSYLFSRSKATIRFVVSCHVVGTEEPLWSVSVDRTRRGVSHREVAVSALKDVFERIRQLRAAGPQ